METATIMIVGRPDVPRPVYQALFAAPIWARVLEPADDAPSAIKRLPVEKPDVVILNTSVHADHTTIILKEITNAGPPTLCLVICLDGAQTSTAYGCGADAAVVESMPPAELAARVRILAGSPAGEERERE